MKTRYTMTVPPKFRDAGEPWHDDHELLTPDPRSSGRLIAAQSMDAWALVIAWPYMDDEQASTVHFVIFDPCGFGDDGPVLQDVRASSSPSPTDDIGRAEWVAAGGVRFDGCANFYWYHDDKVMHHMCGWRGFQQLAQKWQVVYALAAKLVGNDDCLEAGEVEETSSGDT